MNDKRATARFNDTTSLELEMSTRFTTFLAALLLSVFSAPTLASHAVATAFVGERIAYYWVLDQPSKKAAEKTVMKDCTSEAKKAGHTGPCKLLGSADGPKYLAFFHSNDGSGLGVASNSIRQEAIDTAYDQCTKQSECPNTAVRVVFDEGQRGARPTKTAAGGDCRPRTGNLQCRSNCVNGNCVVEYQNGCKIRVQVSPQLDPFSNQWTYPSPSC